MTTKSRNSSKPLTDVYQRITDAIVAQLEAGVRPWHQPWGANGTTTRPLRHNGVPYRGINTVLLWMAACENAFISPFWMTYKQARELGGQVRKSSKSTLVVYAGAIEKTEETESGDEVEHRIPFLKGYCVFNCDQIDNLPDRFHPKPIPPVKPKELNMSTNTFTALEKSPRNAYIKASTRIPDMARIPDLIETKAQVDAVVDAFFLTGDDSIFTRHIRAMTNESFASSFAIMRGSGNELSPMAEFLTIVYDAKVITFDDVLDYNSRYVDMKKAAAA